MAQRFLELSRESACPSSKRTSHEISNSEVATSADIMNNNIPAWIVFWRTKMEAENDTQKEDHYMMKYLRLS